MTAAAGQVGVRGFVRRQLRLLNERPPALFAAVRPLARMRTLVRLKINSYAPAGMQARRSIDRRLVPPPPPPSPVCLSPLPTAYLQIPLTGECLWAIFAFVRPFSSMRSNMDLKKEIQ